MPVNLKLKGLRVAYGYSQAGLAEKIGISKNAYNFKERGKREFNPPEMEFIRNLFEMTPDDFVNIFFAHRVNDCETSSVNE